MPRLFTGFEIPSDLGFELSMMRGGLSGARWIDAENYHITLRFIGDVDHATARDIDASLALIRRPSCEITVDGLSSFGGDRPRALVAKVQPSSPLVELQGEQERLMRRLGLPPEPRKYTPHVTLARLRSAGPIAVADYLGMRGLFLARRFVARRFVLFSARNSVGGGPYVVEATYPLG
jgi:2'-5' RNA ligase